MFGGDCKGHSNEVTYLYANPVSETIKLIDLLSKCHFLERTIEVNAPGNDFQML